MKKYLFLVAIATMAMMAVSCTKENENTEDLTQTPIQITANYGDIDSKVSYTEDGSTITAKWESGDELIVCWNGHKNTLTLSSGAGSSHATFTGSITGTPTANSTLVCFVKDKNNPGAVTVSDNGDYAYVPGTFLAQDGTLAVAAKCNLYYGTCFYGDGSNISCTLSVNTSMMKFTISDLHEDALHPTVIEYKSNGSTLAKATFSAVDGDNTVYLTIPAGSYNGEQSIVYTCGESTETYILSTTRANFTSGKTYSKKIVFPRFAPLTFEAKEANSTVKIRRGNYAPTTPTFQYSTDGTNWNTYTINTAITLTNVGDKVSFREDGDNTALSQGATNNVLDVHYFVVTGSCYIYGNVMSLLDKTDFANATEIPADGALARLFGDLTNIYNHPTQPIILPATTLTTDCYAWMFTGCTSLTTPPELPATTLGNYCYQGMFDRCSSLTTAPELPATTLTSGCYENMFYHCTSLSTAPDLPATTVKPSCYNDMFNGCTSLTTAPALPCTDLRADPAGASHCYEGMFYGCTSLTTAPDLPSTTVTEYCYKNMFYGCTNLTTAPDELPATEFEGTLWTATHCYENMFFNCTNLTKAPDLPAAKLVSYCYYNMFGSCTHLNSVKCLATDISASNCTSGWLYNVAATGTFTKASSMASWTSGSNGIPTYWTVQNQ